MNIEVSPKERDLLLELVDAACREIGPEIRRTRTFTYKDDLKEQRRTLRHLHDQLAAATPQVGISAV